MRALVFGAAGNVGRLVVAEALQRGHEVTAIVRAAGECFRDQRSRMRLFIRAVGIKCTEMKIGPERKQIRLFLSP